jgi:dihydrofolate reductase
MKATVFMGASVDGFIARPDGALDFLPTEPEPHGYEELMASVDALVFGRHTYETVLGFGGAWPYGDKPVFVLSSRPLPAAPEGAKVVHLSGEPPDIVAELESRGVRHAYVDGGVTVQRFLRAGLVQRLIVTRVPVLIGAGIPLFGALSRDVRLRHVGTRSFPSGLVQSEYAIEAEVSP